MFLFSIISFTAHFQAMPETSTPTKGEHTPRKRDKEHLLSSDEEDISKNSIKAFAQQ